MASQELISEIQEYTIMYTLNVTQKLKKWNDGTLKFFKFNNKVQVFNDQSILVSQEFLKNDRNLQEDQWGNEVKMGGVLVMIDSMVSETKREISGLFDKKKDNNAIISKETVVVRPKVNIRTPLKSPGISKSPMTQGKRRVGLSKSMTPSRIALRKVSSGELNQLESSKESDDSKVPDTSLSHKTASETTTIRNPMKITKPLHTPTSDKVSRIPKVNNPTHIINNQTKKRKISNPVPFTPISAKTTTKLPNPLDELSDLDSPSLIKSDRHLLLAPESTPSRESNRDAISWDDETLQHSNLKIIDKIKMQTPITSRSRVIKRIGRSKREVIKIQPESLKTSTSASAKPSNIQVYASDTGSESDEIVSQSQSQSDSLGNGKITQTETYDYSTILKKNHHRKGVKVSDISRL